MSTAARLKCPFTSLGVAPEAASSYLLPLLVGRQNAAWLLQSSEWVSAEEALAMGLVWRVCEPDDLLAEARRHAEVLAARPISSLVAVKRTMTEPRRAGIEAARERENAAFAELMGGPANLEALTAFAEGREPDFSGSRLRMAFLHDATLVPSEAAAHRLAAPAGVVHLRRVGPGRQLPARRPGRPGRHGGLPARRCRRRPVRAAHLPRRPAGRRGGGPGRHDRALALGIAGCTTRGGTLGRRPRSTRSARAARRPSRRSLRAS